MRFSLKSFAFGLLSMQACLTIAGPCKPSSFTSIGHYFSIASAATATILSEASIISGDVTTSAIFEDMSSTTRDESYDDPTTSTVSITANLSAATTTTILPEISGTEPLSGTQTTTFLSEEPTSTALAISTTTSVEAPLGTTLTAVFIDEGYEKEAWLPMDPSPYVVITSNEDTESAGALFGLEAGTSRLYAILPSGEKRYAATCVQCSGGGFAFYTEEERAGGYFVFWAICTEVENRYLSCTPENGDRNSYPHMYFYEVGGNYWQTRYPDRRGQTAVEFRLG
ncbi:hypothetical protein ACHAPZ_010561 [Fusarium culmorum]